MPGPILTRAGGQAAATSPNVDFIPAPPPAMQAPAPLPSITDIKGADATTCTKKVRVLNQPVLVKSTKVPMSTGDAAGVKGGVASGTFMGEMIFLKGSSTVEMEGKAVIYVTCPSSHNKNNAPSGMVLAAAQSAVVLLAD